MRWNLLVVFIALACLAGCMSRPQSVLDAENGAQARIENYAKNQRAIVAGYRSAYIEEAKGHIESKKNWSIERINTQIAAGATHDDKPITTETISAGYADVYAKRDAALLRVAQNVAEATEAQREAEKDMTNARRLWSGVREYDNTPAITLDAIPAFIDLLTPLVAKGESNAK